MLPWLTEAGAQVILNLFQRPLQLMLPGSTSLGITLKVASVSPSGKNKYKLTDVRCGFGIGAATQLLLICNNVLENIHNYPLLV